MKQVLTRIPVRVFAQIENLMIKERIWMWVDVSILTNLRLLVTPLVFQTCLKAQHRIDVLRLKVKIVSINEHN